MLKNSFDKRHRDPDASIDLEEQDDAHWWRGTAFLDSGLVVVSAKTLDHLNISFILEINNAAKAANNSPPSLSINEF